MADASSTNSSRQHYEFKLPTSDGIFPTTTMRLHQRLFGWKRKRHIPVREVDSSKRAEQLSGYMINPKYLQGKEKPVGTTMQDVTVSQPVYQYSQLTLSARNASAPISEKVNRAVRGWKVAAVAGLVALGKSVAAYGSRIAKRIPLTKKQGSTVAYSSYKGAKTVQSRPTTRVALAGSLAVITALLTAGVITQPFSGDTSSQRPTASSQESSQKNSSTSPSSTSKKDASSPSKASSSSSQAAPLSPANSTSNGSTTSPSDTSTWPSNQTTLPVGGLGGGASSSPTPSPTTSASPQPTPAPTAPAPTQPVPILPSTPLDPVLNQATDTVDNIL